MHTITHAPTMDRTAVSSGEVYRAFWRWHFYAGLLVLPVLMLMALTGGVYLFKDDIEGAIYRPLMTVAPRTSSTSPETWIKAAENKFGGRVAQLTPPATASQSAQLLIEISPGKTRTVFVDPHDGHVLGSVDGSLLGPISEGGVLGTFRRLHSLDFGRAPNIVVEIVAGWAIVLIATGVFLWWPRGQDGGVTTIRGKPHRRLFWRDLHAVTGIFAGGLILFLAVTGMPWSAIWGKK